MIVSQAIVFIFYYHRILKRKYLYCSFISLLFSLQYNESKVFYLFATVISPIFKSLSHFNVILSEFR